MDIHQAATAGYVNLVQRALAEKFLDAGFDVHDAGTDGMTTLMIAAYYRCDPVIPRLVAAGANLEHRDQRNKTALGYAAQERKTEAFHALLQAGASITDAVGGESLLIYTCAQANDEAVRALLDAGVDPKERDSDGKTAFFFPRHPVVTYLRFRFVFPPFDSNSLPYFLMPGISIRKFFISV